MHKQTFDNIILGLGCLGTTLFAFVWGLVALTPFIAVVVFAAWLFGSGCVNNPPTLIQNNMQAVYVGDGCMIGFGEETTIEDFEIGLNWCREQFNERN